MPSGTTYNPPNVLSFVKSALIFNSQGASTTIIAGQISNLDVTLTDDCLLTGLEVVINNGNYGDYINFQVVDPTGFTGHPAGTVLLQPASNWYVAPVYENQYDIVYPAKIVTGLTLRIIYTSTGSSNVFLAINYKLHKCLV
jgi:hypothetical protein